MTEAVTQRRHQDFIAVWACLIVLTIYSFILLFDPPLDNQHFLLGLASRLDLRCLLDLGIIHDFIKTVFVDQAVIVTSILFFFFAWRWQRWAVIAIFSMATYVCILYFTVRSDGEGWGHIVGLVGIALLATAIKRMPRAWPFFEGKPFIGTQDIKALNVSDKHRRWLVAWLVFLLIVNSYFVADTITLDLFNWDSRDTAWHAFTLAGNLLNIVSGLASLMWKKWGFIGLGAVTITAIVTSVTLLIMHGHYIGYVMPQLIIAIVGVVVLVVLVRPVWKQLSWK